MQGNGGIGYYIGDPRRSDVAAVTLNLHTGDEATAGEAPEGHNVGDDRDVANAEGLGVGAGEDRVRRRDGEGSTGNVGLIRRTCGVLLCAESNATPQPPLVVLEQVVDGAASGGNGGRNGCAT